MTSASALRLEKILILGANGQVGRALVSELMGHPALRVWERTEADLSDPEKVILKLDALSATDRPTLIINAAAYTQVDLAEKEPELATRINGEAPKQLAVWAAKYQATLIHYSTDYVFSGEGQRPWTETDSPQPINQYGRTKLEGEASIASVMGQANDVTKNGQYLIFRTSWIYAASGRNFVNTMLRLAQTQPELRVVADQIGAPTYAPDLARATLEAYVHARDVQRVSGRFPSGVFHLCAEGTTSWYSFAVEIFLEAVQKGVLANSPRVKAITSAEYPTPAIRPLNSRLDCRRIAAELNVRLPHWRIGLSRFFSDLPV